MRRVTVLLLAVLIGVVGAACDPQLSRKASGTFAGSTLWRFSALGCSLVYQEFEGTWVRREGAPGGTFRLTGCVTEPSQNSFAYEGTFLMVTQGGAELRGTVTSRFEESPCPAPLDHVLTLTSGTKRYSGATGTIFVDGVWDCTQTLPFMAPDPYDGTITAVIESDVRTATGARMQL